MTEAAEYDVRRHIALQDLAVCVPSRSQRTFSRVEHLAAIVSVLMDDDPDTATAFSIVLDLGLKAALRNAVGEQDESIFVESLHQLAISHTEVVYPFVADRIALGADTRKSRADSLISF